MYACGDVAGYGERNPNSRSAMRKAAVAADNVVLAARGERPRHVYEPHWSDEFIKLTLGMVSSRGLSSKKANGRTGVATKA